MDGNTGRANGHDRADGGNYDPEEVVELPRGRLQEIREDERKRAKQEQRELIREEVEGKVRRDIRNEVMREHIDPIKGNVNGIEKRMSSIDDRIGAIESVIESNEQHVYVVPPGTDVGEVTRRLSVAFALTLLSLSVFAEFTGLSLLTGASLAITVGVGTSAVVGYLQRS